MDFIRERLAHKPDFGPRLSAEEQFRLRDFLSDKPKPEPIPPGHFAALAARAIHDQQRDISSDDIAFLHRVCEFNDDLTKREDAESSRADRQQNALDGLIVPPGHRHSAVLYELLDAATRLGAMPRSGTSWTIIATDNPRLILHRGNRQMTTPYQDGEAKRWCCSIHSWPDTLDEQREAETAIREQTEFARLGGIVQRLLQLPIVEDATRCICRGITGRDLWMLFVAGISQQEPGPITSVRQVWHHKRKAGFDGPADGIEAFDAGELANSSTQLMLEDADDYTPENYLSFELPDLVTLSARVVEWLFGRLLQDVPVSALPSSPPVPAIELPAGTPQAEAKHDQLTNSEMVELFAELSPDGKLTMQLAKILADKARSTNDRMIDASELNPALYEKKSPWWANLFGVKPQAITKTDYWTRIRTDFLERMNELQKLKYGDDERDDE